MDTTSEDPKATGPPVQEDIKQDNPENEGKTNLIINYVPQNLTNQEFRRIFAAIGTVKASKVVRDKATGRSYGFGFIDYQDAGDAARAIESLNGLPVLGKTIKVSYARPRSETIQGAKLHVRGIPNNYPLEQAEKVFADFGQLVQFRVIKDISGNGVAFVLYDLRENAEAALAALAGTTLPGATEPLVIKFALPKNMHMESGGRGESERRSHGWNWDMPAMPPNVSHHYMAYKSRETAAASGQTLFVYNIGDDTDEKTLESFLSYYGRVLNVNITRDTSNGLQGGYGFVTMATYDDCLAAIKGLNNSYYAHQLYGVYFKQRKFYGR